MATYGVTDIGFVEKPLVDIEADLQIKAREQWGNDVLLDNDSIAGQAIKIISDPIDELWQALAGVYAAQQFTGAEGLDLDNVLSTQGVYRQGKQRSTGTVEIITDKTITNNFLLPSNTYILSSNKRWQSSSTTVISSSNVSSLLITEADIDLDESYELSITNTVTGDPVSTTPTTNTTVDEVVGMLESWYNFIVSNKPELASKVHFAKADDGVTNNSGILAIGYELETIGGVLNKFAYNISPITGGGIYLDLPRKAGLRGTTVAVTAEIAEYRVVEGGGTVSLEFYEENDTFVTDLEKEKGGVTSLSPTFTGFDSLLNISQFNTGANTETDAEYRFRYNQIIDQVTAATRDAVEGALLQLDDISKVRIYENVTPINEAFADAYSFNAVCLGGDAEEIAETIYDKKPINVKSSGTTLVTITTSNNDPVPIRFSYAINSPMNVRVSYRTKTAFPLTTSEQSMIANTISDFSSSLNIGELVYIEQLKSYVYGILTFGRLISLTVEIKKTTDPDSSYINTDYQPAFNENLSMSTADVLFVQQ